MSKNSGERLLDMIGDVEEGYIQEYLDAQKKARRSGRRRLRLTLVLAAAMVLLFGTVSFGAVPAIGHFLENFRTEQQAVIQNFDQIEAKYAVRVNDTQECDGVIGTLNSAVLEDHYLLLSYTFDWSGLEEAQNGMFHTYYLPWFFDITEGDNVICRSEYTEGLYTQTYAGDKAGDSDTGSSDSFGGNSDGNSGVEPGQDSGENSGAESGLDSDDSMQATFIYCIDLGSTDGSALIGKELTVRLLYFQGGEGFISAFTPETCFTGNSWDISKTYDFDGHKIILNRVQESGLYVTLFIDCDTIGHNEDGYAFVLSDELGSDYTAYPNKDHDTEGYWFIKPENLGIQLTLKVIRKGMEPGAYGEVSDGSYETLYEIPIERKTSFWDRLFD
ncbi:MAG: hypothetical protein NC427_05115 [Ruminococcus flavefaciens]|nr:hypothetical protein [Ruminococcus flavefaciens]